MKIKTKSDKLENALLNGHLMSPKKAWNWWRMQANYYHVVINRLKKRYMILGGSIFKDGRQFSEHWVAINKNRLFDE